MFSDGIIAQAATKVSNNGATYFSSAGNSARASWEADFSGVQDEFLDNIFSKFGIPVGFFEWHDFDGEGTTLQEIKVQSSATQTVILQWNDLFLSQGQGSGASYDFDIFVFDENNDFLGLGSDNRNIGGGAYCALHIVRRRMCTLLTLFPFYSALTRPRRDFPSRQFWHTQVCHWQVILVPGTLCPSQVGHDSRWFWNNFRLPIGWICILNVLRSL